MRLFSLVLILITLQVNCLETNSKNLRMINCLLMLAIEIYLIESILSNNLKHNRYSLF